jgi:hypothetical protein
MEPRSILGALSLLPKGRTLPAGTIWGGNPLRQIGSRAGEPRDPSPAAELSAEADEPLADG